MTKLHEKGGCHAKGVIYPGLSISQVRDIIPDITVHTKNEILASASNGEEHKQPESQSLVHIDE